MKSTFRCSATILAKSIIALFVVFMAVVALGAYSPEHLKNMSGIPSAGGIVTFTGVGANCQDSGVTNGDIVHTSGDETMSGVKTLTSTPVVPAVMSNITTAVTMLIYCDPAGSDITGDGSSGNPYRQIQRALAAIPDVGRYNIEVVLNPGTYAGFTMGERLYHYPQLDYFNYSSYTFVYLHGSTYDPADVTITVADPAAGALLTLVNGSLMVTDVTFQQSDSGESLFVNQGGILDINLCVFTCLQGGAGTYISNGGVTSVYNSTFAYAGTGASNTPLFYVSNGSINTSGCVGTGIYRVYRLDGTNAFASDTTSTWTARTNGGTYGVLLENGGTFCNNGVVTFNGFLGGAQVQDGSLLVNNGTLNFSRAATGSSVNGLYVLGGGLVNIASGTITTLRYGMGARVLDGTVGGQGTLHLNACIGGITLDRAGSIVPVTVTYTACGTNTYHTNGSYLTLHAAPGGYLSGSVGSNLGTYRSTGDAGTRRLIDNSAVVGMTGLSNHFMYNGANDYWSGGGTLKTSYRVVTSEARLDSITNANGSGPPILTHGLLVRGPYNIGPYLPNTLGDLLIYGPLSIKDSGGTTQIRVGSIPEFPNGLTVSAGQTLSTTFYVTTTGTAANSGLTPDYSIDSVQTAIKKVPTGFRGAAWVMVYPGTYDGFAINRLPWAGGTKRLQDFGDCQMSADLVVQGVSGDREDVIFNAGTLDHVGAFGVITLSGVDVTLNSVTIKGENDAGTYGIHNALSCWAGANVGLRNVKLVVTETTGLGAGLDVEGLSTCLVEGEEPLTIITEDTGSGMGLGIGFLVAENSVLNVYTDEPVEVVGELLAGFVAGGSNCSLNGITVDGIGNPSTAMGIGAYQGGIIYCFNNIVMNNVYQGIWSYGSGSHFEATADVSIVTTMDGTFGISSTKNAYLEVQAATTIEGYGLDGKVVNGVEAGNGGIVKLNSVSLENCQSGLSSYVNGGRIVYASASFTNCDKDRFLSGGVLDVFSSIKGEVLEEGDELTISGGAVTAVSSFHSIGGQGGAADDLDNINGAFYVGQKVMLRMQTGGSTITIREVGNIRTGDTSRSLDSINDRWFGQWDGTNWVELSFSNNG